MHWNQLDNIILMTGDIGLYRHIVKRQKALHEVMYFVLEMPDDIDLCSHDV